MGNIAEIKENGLLTVKYAYDKIGRLIREDNRKFGKTTLWSYDNCGNILSKREAQYTIKPTDEITEFTTEKLYAYNGDKLLSFGDEILSYIDNQGIEHVNPVTYRGQALAWNYGRQLASFGDTQFIYDGYGRRIKKGNTVFAYDDSNKLIKQTDGTNTLVFIYDNSGLSGVTYNGTEYIYSKDIQGNIVGILDKDGREVVQYRYDAWGNVKMEVIDEAHACIAELNPFRYRSYYYDTETHLYYLNTRYYDPEIGRFISQDDVSYLDPESINGLNLFAYCGNNPVMGYDPDGTWDWGKIWAAIAGITSALLVVAGAILIATGVGAPIGGVLLGAGIGGTSGFVGNVISQGMSQGFSNINWGQVAFNSFIGMGVGGIMGSPLGTVMSGAIISGLNFVQCVGNDLFTYNGDWGKVKWFEAAMVGISSGIMSGIGKEIKLLSKGIQIGLRNLYSGMAAIDALALLYGLIAACGSMYAAVGRMIVKGITALIHLIFGGNDEEE